MQVTAVFDIGKTNKKFFLFDESLQQVHSESTQFGEIPDPDGYPSDDLKGIVSWIKDRFDAVWNDPRWEIRALNFSTYGASLVFAGENGQPVFPFVNYTKPYLEEVLEAFYTRWGDAAVFARQTASPALGMLNSGMQAYWLKHRLPEAFAQTKFIFHFPQYLSFLFSGIALSDFTSIGCHTALWDFERHTYHNWVGEEGLSEKFPPVVAQPARFQVRYRGKPLWVGSGLHDSSAALMPYLRSSKQPFLLLSTGTWSIALNPFSTDPLTDEELARDTLCYLRPDGKPVKAARLFLGNEYNHQVTKLCSEWEKPEAAAAQVAFDPHFQPIERDIFQFSAFRKGIGTGEDSRNLFPSFSAAYHQLMAELMTAQTESIRLAVGSTPIQQVFVDGGFTSNEVFVQMLKKALPEYEVRVTPSPLGSSLGAALAVEENFELRTANF
jgi:sugar (pentulose or hexulose) kinase